MLSTHKKICPSLEQVTDLGDLSRLLKTLQNVTICKGIQLSDFSILQSNRLYQDIFGTWWDKNCTIVPGTSICNSCQKLQKVICQQRLRLSKRPKRSH